MPRPHALDLRPWVLLPGHGRPARPPAPDPECRPRRRAGPADLARALHLPARARLRRSRGRGARAGRLAVVRERRHDDRARVRRGLRGEPRRLVPGGRDARDPGDRRQGDDGSRHATTRSSSRPTSSSSPCASRRTSSSAGTAATTAGCSTRSRRGSPSRARPSCCASPRRWPPRPGRTGRRTSPRIAARSPRSRGCSPRPWTTWTSTTAPAASGAKTVLAHAVHLSDRELARLVETGTHVAHCPASNLFLASGVMPLARYLEAGLVRRAGLGRRRRPGPLDLHGDAGRASTPRTRCASAGWPVRRPRRRSTGSGWARSTARGRLGLDGSIGSLEAGKEADLIAVDPAFVAAVPGGSDDDPEDLASRLIFRSHPDMVRAAWVRGRRLEGPGARG